MNLVQFLRDLSGDPEEFDRKAEEERKKSKKHRFNIGGQSGFKWRTESANKTWIENDKVIKEKKGKIIPKY
mgnify:CR=1 FL=1|tara:strand:- start:30 stop:242 length:213 start_codon:yes stop_codon:yes gene_type:complete